MNYGMIVATGVTAAAMLMTGCASTPAVREVALDRAPISSKLEPQDVRRTVEKMTESLLSAPGVREAVGGSRPVLDVEPLSKESKDPWGNIRRGTTATTKINRKDFGLVWNKALETGGVAVGEEVLITLEVELIKAQAK